MEAKEEHAKECAIVVERAMQAAADYWCTVIKMNADAVIGDYWAH